MTLLPVLEINYDHRDNKWLPTNLDNEVLDYFFANLDMVDTWIDGLTELHWPPREVTGFVEDDQFVTVYATGGLR